MRTNVASRIMVNGLLLGMSLLPCAGQKKPIAAQENLPSQRGREKVKVHGHWTIVVRNADGSISSRREFENSLISSGQLNELLAHQATTPIWWLILKFSGSNKPWILNPSYYPGGLQTLAVYAPSTGANAGKLVLTGSVPGTSVSAPGQPPLFLSGQLTFVETNLNVTCLPNATCSVTGGGFSSRDLTVAVPPDTTAPPPINVQQGQGIDVTVVLSFQ